MTEMTYSESAKGVRIGVARALQELRVHGITSTEAQNDMIRECFGDEPTADAGDVLAWLGY